MKIKRFLTSVALLAAIGSVASAYDQIHVFDAKRPTISGTIGPVGISKNSVTIQGRASTKVPVSQIRYILFDKDSKQVSDAKITARSGGYAEALEQLKQATASNFEGAIKTDVEFYILLCRANLALAGEEGLRDAAKALNSFIANNKNSYHYYEANELLGDLLKAVGSFSSAAKFYGKLSDNPDYAMRANVAIGWLSLAHAAKDPAQAKAKLGEAEAAFDKVLANRKNDSEAKRQKLSARLGKANCMAEGDNPDEAIKLVNKVIAEADPADWALHARTYNALGKLQKKANRKKAAIQAYLHVDLLYAQDPNQHAEALGNLVKLFSEVKDRQNEIKARSTLRQLYPNSRWAKGA